MTNGWGKSLLPFLRRPQPLLYSSEALSAVKKPYWVYSINMAKIAFFTKSLVQL